MRLLQERAITQAILPDSFARATVAGFYRHMEMADGPLTALIRSLDTHEIMAGLRKTMLRHRVTILGVLLDVAI